MHGDRPHNKSTDIPSKIYDAAMCHSLSTKFLQSQLVILDQISYNTLSIKDLLMKRLGSVSMEYPKKVYLMFGDPEVDTQLVDFCDEFNDKLKGKGPRNPPLLLSSVRDISVCPLMEREFLVLDKQAIEYLEAKYRKSDQLN